MADLQPFDGRDVRRTTISITNAGDGLSQALKIEPRELHIGEKVFVVLECEVGKLRFVPIDNGEDLTREHILRAQLGTIVDEAAVRAALDAQRDRLIAAAEAISGAQQIPSVDRAEEHREGRHKRFRKDCELCAEERAAKEDAKRAKA